MRDEFVLVKSEDEMRPGMCVELRPCLVCNNRERMVLLQNIGCPTGSARLPDGSLVPCDADAWSVSNACRGKTSTLDAAIRERRLYRLRDDDTAADETATNRRKERVR